MEYFTNEDMFVNKDMFINEDSLMLIFDYCDSITKLCFYMASSWKSKLTKPIVSKKDKCLNPNFPSYPRHFKDKIKYAGYCLGDIEIKSGFSIDLSEEDKRVYAKYISYGLYIFDLNTTGSDKFGSTSIQSREFSSNSFDNWTPKKYFLKNKDIDLFRIGYLAPNGEKEIGIIRENIPKYPLPILLFLAKENKINQSWDILLKRQDLCLANYKELFNLINISTSANTNVGNCPKKVYLKNILWNQTLDVVLWVYKTAIHPMDFNNDCKWRDFEVVKWAYENTIVYKEVIKNQCILWGKVDITKN